jgi:hypothetical protein
MPNVYSANELFEEVRDLDQLSIFEALRLVAIGGYNELREGHNPLSKILRFPSLYDFAELTVPSRIDVVDQNTVFVLYFAEAVHQNCGSIHSLVSSQ